MSQLKYFGDEKYWLNCCGRDNYWPNEKNCFGDEEHQLNCLSGKKRWLNYHGGEKCWPNEGYLNQNLDLSLF